ncbi:MAG TPA: RHS repeat domain-containing protein [Alphaproteobacteria bacterium]|jgi:YD repeat-containing protein
MGRPVGGTIVYVRDSAGNVTQKTDARGQVVQYSYDALNRVTAATFSGAPSFNITYSYDSTAGGNYGIGRLTSVTDTSGQTAIRYDHRGNVAGEDRTIGRLLFRTGAHLQAACEGWMPGARNPRIHRRHRIFPQKE